jgi:hypothetical protein
MRRLTAEELRDAMLAVSGELNREPGGPPARPQMNWDAAKSPVNLMPGLDIPYRPALTPAARNRRSLYALVMRSRRDPSLEVFDQPASERSCERRNESIIVPQAFTLMNGDFANDRALALAARLARAHAADAARVEAAYAALFGRAPSAEESAHCRSYLAAQTAHHERTPPTPSLVREQVAATSPYDPGYAVDYVPDLQPAEVDAPVRALADLCLLLFNTSEFLYVP